MRLARFFPVAVLLACAPFLLNACKQQTQTSDQAHQYTCPMHPEVVQDKPGNCPKCGMKLVEKK